MSDRFGTISIHPEPAPPSQKARRAKPGLRPTPKKSVPGSKKTRRWRFLLAIPIFLFGAYGAGGFFLAPSLLTGYLSDSLQQSANMGLTAGEAHFNPFTLRLQLDNIATTESGRTSATGSTFLKIDHFRIDLNLLALLRKGLACKRMEVQGLELTLIRYPDKSYNLPSLVSGKNSGAEKGHLSLSRPPLLFSLNNIAISDGRILFDDRLTGKKHRVEQIKLDLPTLSNYPFATKEYIRPHFSAVINGSPLELTGEAALPGEDGRNGLKTNLSCKVQDLDLPLYFAYLPKSLPLVLSKGKGNGKIQISFSPEDKKGGRLSVAFQLTTTEIELGNKEKSLSLTAPTMEMDGSVQPLEGSLRIHTLHALQPHVAAEQDRLSQDIAQLFSGSAPSPEAPEQRHHLRIDSLSVEDGTLQLRNKERQDPDPPPWQSIQLQVKGFSTAQDQPKDTGTFALNCKQEKTNTSLTWQGSFNNGGIPGGTLQLQSVQASDLLSFIDPLQAAEASGSASLRGHLTFNPTALNSGMVTLVDADTEIHDLILLDQKERWLTAKTVRIKGSKFKKVDRDLGTIAVEEGVLTLHQGKFPPFLGNLGDTQQPIRLQGLHFSGKATLHPQQKKKAPPLQLDELKIQASNLAAMTNSQNNLELTARINQTGTVKAQGPATLFPLRSSLSLVFAAINSEQIAPWLPDAPLFQRGRATVHGQGTYRYPESIFTGTVQLSSALIRDSDKSSGLAVNRAELKDVTIKARPLRLDMMELILDGPQLTWKQGAESPGPFEGIASFLRNLVSPGPDNGGQQEKGGNSALPLIRKISFDNGTINHVDQRLNPPWSSKISQLKGSLNNLHAKSGPGASLDLSGLIDSTPFTLSGSADFLASPVNFTTRLVLKGFPILSLSPQITPLLDINPQSGSFDLSLSHKRQNGEEEGEAGFLFSALRPGSAQSDAALTLALLADSREQMQLLIPLAKNSAQPLFNQTLATFQALMVKTSAAPLLLVDAEFADLEEKQHVEFPLGRSELDINAGGQTLRRFAALLAARPHLGLTLTGMADPTRDRDAILKKLEAKERKRVALKNEQRVQEWQTRQKQRQQAALKASPAPPQGTIIEQDIPVQEAPPAPLSPEPVTVSDTTLHDLAQERALQIYDFCTTDLGIASARISLQEKSALSLPETPGNQVLIGLKYVEQAGQ